MSAAPFPTLTTRLEKALGVVSAGRNADDTAKTGSDYPKARATLLQAVDIFERQVTKFSVGVGTSFDNEAALASLCQSTGKHGDGLAAAAVMAQACAVSQSLWKGITTPVECIFTSMIDLVKFTAREGESVAGKH